MAQCRCPLDRDRQRDMIQICHFCSVVQDSIFILKIQDSTLSCIFKIWRFECSKNIQNSNGPGRKVDSRIGNYIVNVTISIIILFNCAQLCYRCISLFFHCIFFVSIILWWIKTPIITSQRAPTRCPISSAWCRLLRASQWLFRSFFVTKTCSLKHHCHV